MSPAMVGRVDELAILGRALDAASSASGVVLIAGEAGVGKTRLIGAMTERASRQGFRVCLGRCVDLGEQIWPLAPLREIFASLVDELDPADLDVVLGPARDALGGLVPGVHDGASGGAPLTGEQVCHLAVGVFRRLAVRAPLLVVIEDLHWADQTTRQLFAVLAGVGCARPSLLVGTFRPDDLHRRHPLRGVLAELQRHPSCERVDLGPLDLGATSDLVAAITPGGCGRAMAAQVHRRSGGNPFHIEELVAAGERGVHGLPATLRDAILARTGMLDETSQQVLAVIAAAGATTPAVIADVGRMALDDVRDALDRLYERALLVVDGEDVRFRHELAREVVDEELLPGARFRIHADLAVSIERRRPGRFGEIAHHWSAAHDPPRALGASIAAGRQALALGAAAEAAGHFERALELWGSVEGAVTITGTDHAGLLLESAVAAQHARHIERAIALDLIAVDELAGVDAHREARIWLHLRDLYRYSDRFEDCERAVRRALELIPASPPSALLVEALSDATAASIDAGRLSEASEEARRAVAAAEVVDDRDALIRAYYALWQTAADRGEHQHGLEIAEANVARCGPATATEVALLAITSLNHALCSVARHEEAMAAARRGAELARASGLGGARASWMAMFWLEGLANLGRWDELDRMAVELSDLSADGCREADLALPLGTAWIRQGRLAEARPLIEDARRRWLRTPWAEDLDFMLVPVVMLDGAEDRLDEAIALIDQQLQRRPGYIEGPSALVAAGMAVLADHLSEATGDPSSGWTSDARATADRWLDHLAALERSGPPLDVCGRASRAQVGADYGRLCGHRDLPAWSAAVAAWADVGFPYEEAEARFHLAEALLTGVEGRSAEARMAASAELQIAHSITGRLPAPPLQAKIENLARRARIPLGHAAAFDPLTTRPGGDGAPELTRRELDVLDLLAKGRTNGEIADQLYISRKTASVHVSNILRKLGVTNRVEAAAVVLRGNIPTSAGRPGADG